MKLKPRKYQDGWTIRYANPDTENGRTIKANGVDYFVPTEVEKRLSRGNIAVIPLSRPVVVKGKRPDKDYDVSLLGLALSWYDKMQLAITNNHADKLPFIPKDKLSTINQGDMTTSVFDRSSNPVRNAIGRTYVPAALIAAGANLPTLAAAFYNTATVGNVVGGTVGGVLGDVATNGVTKAITGKSWNDYLTSKGVPIEVATLSNPGAWIGGAAGATGRGIINRYKFANMPIVSPETTFNAIKDRLEPKGISAATKEPLFVYKNSNTLKVKDISRFGLFSNKWTSESPNLMLSDSWDIDGLPFGMDIPVKKLFTSIDGPVVSFTKDRPISSFQMHLNPDIKYTMRLGPDDIWDKIKVVPKPTRRTAILGGRLFEAMPSGSAVTLTSDAKVLPQYIREAPLKDRIRYYLTGQFETGVSKPKAVPEGYSTDVMEQLEKMSKNGKGVLLDAENSVMPSTNIYGSSYSKYKPYFGTPTVEGEVLFTDMSPAQVEAWNRDYGYRFGFIDPIDRTIKTKVFIKK